ncbi:MAG: amidohydrolase [Porticoccaceae bacterium]|jgi:predicted amidohydrolase YtcJ|nr:amidohydrolase [Porticoccaceae bacterium]
MHNKLFGGLLSALFLLGLVACSESEPAQEQGDSAAHSAVQSTADWILINGKILTVDPEFSQVEAMAIEDGLVLATGTNEEIQAFQGAETEVTDLQNQTVIPGLIDNHMHYVRATKHWYRSVRLDGVKSRTEAFALIQERASNLPEGEWLMVMGGFVFDQFQDDSEIFNREELDQVLPDRPLYMQEGYSRAFVNSAALEAAGVSNETVSPGLIRDEQGELTGELRGGATYGLVDRHIPEPSELAWDNSVKLTIDGLLSSGLTTVYDVGGNTVTPAFYESVGRIADARELKMRVFYSLNEQNSDSNSAEEIMAEMRSNSPDLEGLRFAQFGYGETVYRPMRANPFVVSDEDREHFKNISITAVENGWQTNEHSSREIKISAMLDLLEEVAESHPAMLDMRFTIAHTNGIQPASIERAKALGMVFAVHSSRRQSTISGSENPASQPPAQVINDLGGTWGLGSDATTVGSPNPMHTIGWVVSGRNIAGNITQPFTVSREDALRAHTATNAYILFREDHLGSLEPGKQADFVVLDRDYMTVPEEEIEDLYSVMTVVEGEVVYAAPEL